jgi:hypothetical protein
MPIEEMTERSLESLSYTKMINLLDLSIQGPNIMMVPPDRPVPKPEDRKK